MGLDKSKKKNWINGDTFAIKIKNNSEYNGRYIILIRHDYDDSNGDICFRAKLTKKNKIPANIEELNDLDYIKTGFMTIEDGVKLPIENNKDYNQIREKKRKLERIVDEYGYLYEYKVFLYMKRGLSYDEFVYLGNYDVFPPKDEYITSNTYYVYHLDKKVEEAYFVNKLINNYNDFNQRKSSIYIKENCLQLHSKSQEVIASISYFLNQCKENNNKIEQINGWGPGLYESDVALDIKADYQVLYRNKKKSKNEIVNELMDMYDDYINDSIDGPVFWLVLADQQLKHNLLDQKIKEQTLKAIKEDLKNWKGKDNYLERKKELEKLEKKLNNYIL